MKLHVACTLLKRIINALQLAVMVGYDGKTRNGLAVGWKLAKIIE